MQPSILVHALALIACAAAAQAATSGSYASLSDTDDGADAPLKACTSPQTLHTLVGSAMVGSNSAVNDVTTIMNAIANLRSEAEWQVLCAQYPPIATAPQIVAEKNRILTLRQKYTNVLAKFRLGEEDVEVMLFNVDAAYRQQVQDRVSPEAYSALLAIQQQNEQSEKGFIALEMSELVSQHGLDALTAPVNQLARQQPRVRRFINALMDSLACAMQQPGQAIGAAARLAGRGLRVAGISLGVSLLVYVGYLIACLMLWIAGFMVYDVGFLFWLVSHLLFIQRLTVFFPVLGMFICQLGLAGLFAGLALGALNPLNPDRAQPAHLLHDAKWFVDHGVEGMRRAAEGGYSLQNIPFFF